MKRFIEGRDRNQQILLPEQLDDYVTDCTPVRVVNVFVDELDLVQMGFAIMPAATGRLGYHPQCCSRYTFTVISIGGSYVWFASEPEHITDLRDGVAKKLSSAEYPAMARN